ncbi:MULTISPECIES: NUDIX hydrolase [Flavobacterium]|uniref:NUDIX hydrolase n=1 Tax=Flavobacterium endoglycinae TaxID=2816357 RepID=A0ABX7QIH9_9FLAO|nr:NUDIX hydrolase [Flavobacterium endoglycinae]QSW90191.1 NUDIX hydrolase [Flavobacterium endoglycinae]
MKKEESEEGMCRNSYRENKIEINCVIFCFEDKKLKVLLIKNESDFDNHKWKLPSAGLNEMPMLQTAQEILRRYISSDDFFLDQLKAFGHHSSLVQENISIVYYAMVRKEKTQEEQELHSNLIWIEANTVTQLDANDRMMLDFSLKELKKNICCSAIGFNLLAEKFTLLQVVNLYEEILGIQINKVNFRRKILQRRLVQSLDEKEEGVSYRAAKFYSLNVPKNEVTWNVKFNFIF